MLPQRVSWVDGWTSPTCGIIFYLLNVHEGNQISQCFLSALPIVSLLRKSNSGVQSSDNERVFKQISSSTPICFFVWSYVSLVVLQIVNLPKDKLSGDAMKRRDRIRDVKILLESSLMKLDDAILLFHDFLRWTSVGIPAVDNMVQRIPKNAKKMTLFVLSFLGLKHYSTIFFYLVSLFFV